MWLTVAGKQYHQALDKQLNGDTKKYDVYQVHNMTFNGANNQKQISCEFKWRGHIFRSETEKLNVICK